MIEVPTPTSIYQDNEDWDVFWDILEHAGFTAEDYITDLDNALWDRFRYHMINGSSVEIWVQLMKDKARSLYKPYKALLDAVSEIDQTDMQDGHTRMLTHNENELMPDVPVNDDDRYLSSRGDTEQNIYTQGGLNALTFGAITEAYVDLYTRFAREFDGLFLNRW